jgi:hypothetical protein
VCGLELLDALEDGRRAETDLLAETDERGSTVLLQQAEYAEVYVVELEVLVIAESHKAAEGLRRTFTWVHASMSMVLKEG